MARTADEEARAFWRETLGEHPTPEQIENELHDFYLVIQEVPKVYDAITGGRFSKPTTMAAYIIDRVEELQAEAVAETQAENRALRTIAGDLHWTARRYCDGRSSYATSLFNQHTRALLALGVPLNPTGDNTVWARDSMGRKFDGLSDAEAAEGRPLDAIRLLAWRDEETDALRERSAALEAERDRLREIEATVRAWVDYHIEDSTERGHDAGGWARRENAIFAAISALDAQEAR